MARKPALVNTTAKGRCFVNGNNPKLLMQVIKRLMKDGIAFELEDVDTGRCGAICGGDGKRWADDTAWTKEDRTRRIEVIATLISGTVIRFGPDVAASFDDESELETEAQELLAKGRKQL